MTLIARICQSMAFGSALYAAASSPFATWYPRSPALTLQTLNSVAFGNGRFIAVGDNGTIVTSTNGIDWLLGVSATTNRLNKIVFGKNRFVVGGDSGMFLWSENGIDWFDASVPGPYHVTAVGFGIGTNYPSGRFVAFATTNIAMSSTSPFTISLVSDSGTNWNVNQPREERLETKSFMHIGAGFNRFVATGQVPPIQGPRTLSSTTGSNWLPGTVLSGPIAFVPGLFVNARVFNYNLTGVVLLAQQSMDGITWSSWASSTNSQEPALGLCHGHAGFVAVGPRYAAHSMDGTNWTTVAVETDSRLRGLAYGSGVYVAVGDGGVIMSSGDAVSWTKRSSGPARDLQAVAAADRGFIASGNAGTIVWSSNGIDWESIPSPTTNTLYVALKAHTNYLFAGGAGTIITGSALTNLDSRASGTSRNLLGGAYGNGTFVLVGGDAIAVSTNALDWSLQPSGTTNSLLEVAFGNGQFVAVGTGGTILTSSDGITWSPQNSGTNWWLSDIAYGNGRFVVHGSLGLLTSSDGTNWFITIRAVIDPSGLGIVAFGNGFFVVQRPFASVGRLLISADGEDWQQITVMNSVIPALDLAYNNGTFLGVGGFGRIIQSEAIVRLTAIPGLMPQILVEGPTDRIYRIEATDNPAEFSSWSPVATLPAPPYIWTAAEAAALPKRFYRAVLLP